MYSQRSYKFSLRKNLYPNLLFEIFPKIHEKYHPYLRLVSPIWQYISSRNIISPKIDETISSETLKKIMFNRKLISLSEIIKLQNVDNNFLFVWGCINKYVFRFGCLFGDKIFIRNTIDKVFEMWNRGLAFEEWNTGLAWACRGGNIDIVRCMIVKGATRFDWGLAWACGNGHIKIVKFMIEKGATSLNWGFSEACENGHLEIVKLMIENGAIINQNDIPSYPEHIQTYLRNYLVIYS